MLQKVRERLVLVLIVVLPFHAFLVTVGTKMIVGPGHAPLPMLALWKEYLLAVVLCIACIEILRNLRTLRFDVIDLCIIGLLSLVFFVSNLESRISNLESPIFSLQFALGFKYSLLPLVAFLVLRRVAWTEHFSFLVSRFLLLVGVVVAVYGIVTYVLPQAFFTWLGYSDLHSLYVPDAPLAAFQQIGGTTIRRMQSTMSGPNQLGMWLLIPFGICLVTAFRTNKFAGLLVCWFFVSTALLLTFSRAAWMVATLMIMMALWRYLPQKKFLMVAVLLSILGFVVTLGAAKVAPGIFEREISSRGHIERPLQALRLMVQQPLGLGLGSAGPARNRFSDTCVFLPIGGSEAWAKDRSDLCVFVGDVQMQPVGRVCACPLLTENWYLQIGVELGVIGLVLYLMLTIAVLKRLADEKFSIFNFQFSIFLGLSLAALFLHAFEDSAIAYTVWILVAVALQPRVRWNLYGGKYFDT